MTDLDSWRVEIWRTSNGPCWSCCKDLITWDLNVDSTVCRAHQHAAGAGKKGDLQKEPPGGVAVEPDDHGLGARAAA